jgi:hypothetical protein
MSPIRLLLALAAACADPAPPAAAPGALLRVDAVPALTLQVTPVVPGAPLRLQVGGAPAGTTVYFVRGAPSGTTCPPPMRGQCVGMGGATLLGQARAGADGAARIELVVPTTVPPGFDVSFGAVIITPTAVAVSQIVDTEVQRPSACGDRVCGAGEAHGSCPLDCAAPVTCGDGVCAPGEACPGDCAPCVGPACDTALRDTSHTIVVDDTDVHTIIVDTDVHTIIVVDDTDAVVDTGVDTIIVDDTDVVDTDVVDTGVDTIIVDDTDAVVDTGVDTIIVDDTDVVVDTGVDDTDSPVDTSVVIDTSDEDTFDTDIIVDSTPGEDSADSGDSTVIVDTDLDPDSADSADSADTGGVVDTSNEDTAETGDTAGADTYDTDDTDDSDADTADTAAPKDSVDASRITPYAKKCRDQKVPMPPKWGRPGWVKQDPPVTPVFAGKAGDIRTELWRYDNARGTCAALPRIVANTPAPPAERIRIMGTICMSKTTGKTCFWDSRSKANGNTVPVNNGFDPITGGVDADSPKVPDGMGGMKEVIELCTDCHRGRNPWVSIQGTTTDDLPNPPATPAWSPIGPTGWENPAAPPGQPASCTDGCHSIPKLSAAWCGIASDMVDQRAMPPGGFDLTTADGRAQKTKWEAILAECARL